MDKKQQNHGARDKQGTQPENEGRPGQELPANATQEESKSKQESGVNEQHSESSMPSNEGETLGTP